ncbi:reverse transcriptase-like protein [Sphingomonas sp. QA11]|uniref:reverse transcriptase-like protein n=1 Tax=Sphingomonas sp. QA11 TaxID=2950605 RepID=UPI00300E27C9
MDAEWLALIHAVGLARKLGLTYVVFIGDSVAVVNQANGTAKCRGGNIQHLEEFRAITSAANPPRIRHIKRSQNLAGIALARLHAR